MNDLVFKKQENSSYPNRKSKALTSDELNTVLYEKGLLGTLHPEVLLNTL